MKAGATIERMIRMAPMKIFGVIFSFRKIIPRAVAARGFRTVRIPARSGEMYFWPSGCRVNPTPLQIRASARIAPHSVLL